MALHQECGSSLSPDFSQPKALIVLGIARDGKATFAPHVQRYIDGELSLKL
jgi:hypothetical protein